MLFNYDSFKKLLIEIKEHYHYTFLRFDQSNLNNFDKIFYLRHDIDLSPYSAHRLGKIEHSLNIKANFFFQLDAETYNIFNSAVIQIIKNLKSLGHCVGLHIATNTLSDQEEIINSTLKWFNKCITPIDLVVSFHRPSKSILYKEFKSFLSAYQNQFFSFATFLSDSRKNHEFYDKLITLLEAQRTPIQLLLHPVWWYPEEDLLKLKAHLEERRLAELNMYLKTNFNNLKELIKNENRTFGL
ncbi:MAG: hypothetical protein ACTSRS_06105 [Candidatus Helarchaeota archaeon]